VSGTDISRTASHASRGGQRATALALAHAWELGLWAAMLVWSLSLFLVVRDHFLNFRLGRYDLGNMVQAVWSTAHGHPLETTNGATGEQMVRLGSHVDPILAALVPLWMLAPSPLTLVALQVTAVSLGALPVFWLARKRLEDERVAGILALAYLAYPWVSWTAADVFHPVTLAIPILLFGVWFLDSDRLVLFALCALLAMTCGELIPLSVAALGVWYGVARGKKAAGMLIAGAAVAWTAVALYVVVPAFSSGQSVFYGAYQQVGGSPAGIVRTAITDPLAVLSALTSWHDFLYLFLLAAPLAGLFVLAPALAAVALPQLSANLLADWTPTTDPRAHYVAAIVPFLIAAVALGLARVSPLGRMRGAILVLTLCLVSTVMVGPWPGAVAGAPDFYRTNQSPEFLDTLERAVALVPKDAPVSTTNRLGSHLADRRYLYSVPVLGRSEWVVMDTSDAWIPGRWGGGDNPAALRALRARLEASASWRRVLDADGVFVFRRVER
jgi:uncharacterized membrane protein